MTAAAGEKEPALYCLRNAGVEGPAGTVVASLDLEIPDRSVTVLLGPAGSGKSRILEGLSGGPVPDGFNLRGSWTYRGEERNGSWRTDGGRVDILFVPQRRSRASERTSATEEQTRWNNVFRSGAHTILLDEPDRQVTDSGGRELIIALILRHREMGSVVLVTHDQQFARAVADYVILICAGQIVSRGSAAQFFESPGHPLAERFLRQGNCWPAMPAPPDLPNHFRWILPGQLAGMGSPGLMRDVELDLTAIAGAGISLLVSLTEESFPFDTLRAFGIVGRHFPIPDMGVPGIGPAARLCRSIEKSITQGQGVAVHCRAGQGRTGTILAAYLVWVGRSPDEAVAEIRCQSSGFIQTRVQHEFISRFAASV